MADLCGFPSSVSDEVCDLPPGHAAASPDRFHRFTARKTLVTAALVASLAAHEAAISFDYAKGHHYGGSIDVGDVVAGMLARLPKVDKTAQDELRWAAEARAGAFEDLARELVARWRDGRMERTEAEIVDAFEVLLKEPRSTAGWVMATHASTEHYAAEATCSIAGCPLNWRTQ